MLEGLRQFVISHQIVTVLSPQDPRVVETMRRLAPTHGARWRPAPLLERLAAAGQGWDSTHETKTT